MNSIRVCLAVLLSLSLVMKKYVLALSILPLLLAACTAVNTPTNNPGTEKNTSSEGAMMKEESHMKGVVMLNGKMMTIWDNNEMAEGDKERDEQNQDAALWNGNETAMMDKETELKNGATVMMDGSVKMADGKTVQLHDGDAMMMDGSMKKSDKGATMKKEGEAMMKPGAYKDATAALLSASVLTDGTTKVLFFHASWCPICKAANQTLTSWYSDGKGLLTVYKIDYDKEKMLKQKYGVTYQHTFVKIDGKGNVIKSITGPSDDDLKDLLKA